MRSSTLGALMTDNRAVEKVSEITQADHFFVPVHGRIYDAIAKLVDRAERHAGNAEELF